MRHAKFSLAALTLALLPGCATIVTESNGGPNAPEGSSKGRTGTVVYNPHGIKEVVDMRRDDAFKKIVEFCGSRKYKVVKEETRDASDTSSTDDSLATAGASELRHIQFTCN